jgi:hypothetical protein
LAEAIQRAGTTEGKRLRDALAETKNFVGVTGIISMDPERNAVKPAVVLKLQDGKYIYQETIQPRDSIRTSARTVSCKEECLACPFASHEVESGN